MTKKEPVPRPGKPYDTPIPTRSKWADRLNEQKTTREAEEAARQESAYPADETNEG